MKNTLRKSLSMLLALMMIFAVMLSATACGGGGNGGDPDDKGSAGRSDFIESLGGVSDTFKGAVSEEGYETAKEAAAAFVAEEVVGESEANIVSAVSKGTVEASSINIPEEYTEGIVSVEEYEVEYSLSEGASLISTSNSNKKIKVYIIKYETEWKYFTPAPITGETISKSYYDSVFNYEKYKNCTFKNEMEMETQFTTTTPEGSGTMTMVMEMTQLIKHSEGKIYLEVINSMTATMKEGTKAPETMSETSSVKAYIESVDGEFVCYIDLGDGDGWQEAYSLSAINFSSLEELTPFYDQYLDYSYFTKTDYGFNISDENAAHYVEQVYSELSEFMIGDGFDIDMYAEYYVSEGVLSGMRVDVDMDVNMSIPQGSVSGGATVVSKVTCTDYGTTAFDKPAMN